MQILSNWCQFWSQKTDRMIFYANFMQILIEKNWSRDFLCKIYANFIQLMPILIAKNWSHDFLCKFYANFDWKKLITWFFMQNLCKFYPIDANFDRKKLIAWFFMHILCKLMQILIEKTDHVMFYANYMQILCKFFLDMNYNEIIQLIRGKKHTWIKSN